MPRAKLSISVPGDVWIRDVSTAHPETTFRVVTALAGERSGIGLVELRTDDPLAVLTDVDRQDDVVDLDLVWKRDDRALLQVETTSLPLLVPLWQAGVPVEMPFEIRDGVATWELTTTSDRFSELGRHLDEAGIDYEIEHVREIGSSRADRILTDRQQEVLSAAIDLGYYATPREATLTEVAEDLGVAKATCSDVLHRAESSIVSWFADEH